MIEQPVIKLLFPSKNVWVLEKMYELDGYVIPIGTTTDLVSIPRVFWSIYPPFGSYLGPSIIHDALLDQANHDGEISFQEVRFADDEFLRLMSLNESDVSFFTRYLFYYGCVIYHFARYGVFLPIWRFFFN